MAYMAPHQNPGKKHGNARRNAREVYIFQRPMHDTVGLLLPTEEMDARSSDVGHESLSKPVML